MVCPAAVTLAGNPEVETWVADQTNSWLTRYWQEHPDRAEAILQSAQEAAQESARSRATRRRKRWSWRKG